MLGSRHDHAATVGWCCCLSFLCLVQRFLLDPDFQREHTTDASQQLSLHDAQWCAAVFTCLPARLSPKSLHPTAPGCQQHHKQARQLLPCMCHVLEVHCGPHEHANNHNALLLCAAGLVDYVDAIWDEVEAEVV